MDVRRGEGEGLVQCGQKRTRGRESQFWLIFCGRPLRMSPLTEIRKNHSRNTKTVVRKNTAPVCAEEDMSGSGHMLAW